jgi:hypothetical protein
MVGNCQVTRPHFFTERLGRKLEKFGGAVFVLASPNESF